MYFYVISINSLTVNVQHVDLFKSRSVLVKAGPVSNMVDSYILKVQSTIGKHLKMHQIR